VLVWWYSTLEAEEEQRRWSKPRSKVGLFVNEDYDGPE
jgi:hypothetical protein